LCTFSFEKDGIVSKRQTRDYVRDQREEAGGGVYTDSKRVLRRWM
jgi:hypothetical protein